MVHHLIENVQKLNSFKIVQSRGFICGPPNEFISPDIFDSTKGLMPLVSWTARDTFVNAGLNLIGKKVKKGFWSITGPGINLTNNEIKDIIKIIESLKSRRSLLKGSTKKITSQKGGFLNFLRLLKTTG